MYKQLLPLIPQYWSELQNTKAKEISNHENHTIIPDCSIPIIWHGNLGLYEQSNRKVVTVSINPHPRAFGPTNPQFDMDLVQRICQKTELNDKDMIALIEQFDTYFERNHGLLRSDPVFRTYETILNQLNSSYLPKTYPTSQALHVDMFTPLATDPTWSKLKKQFPEFALGLEHRGKKLFQALIKVLNPDLILVSLEKRSIIDVFDIDDTWDQLIFPKETTKKNNINAILYTSPTNQHILYGQYNLYGKQRKTFGYANDKEFEGILSNLRIIFAETDGQIR